MGVGIDPDSPDLGWVLLVAVFIVVIVLIALGSR
jgi:hypothetical protein